MAVQNSVTDTFGGEVFSDSYPYVTPDSMLWLDLFANAYCYDRELFAKLNYLRGAGATLEKTGNPAMKYKIVPIIGDKGWKSQQEWDKEKLCLTEHIDLLVRLLNALWL